MTDGARLDVAKADHRAVKSRKNAHINIGRAVDRTIGVRNLLDLIAAEAAMRPFNIRKKQRTETKFIMKREYLQRYSANQSHKGLSVKNEMVTSGLLKLVKQTCQWNLYQPNSGRQYFLASRPLILPKDGRNRRGLLRHKSLCLFTTVII